MKKNAKLSSSGKRAAGFLLFVLVILIGVVSVHVTRLYIKNTEQETEIQRLEQEIEAQRQKQEELLEYIEYMQTTEYIEQVAKERLGLIKPDETIFIEEDND